MKHIFLLFACLLFASSAFADGFKTEPECRQFADNVVDELVHEHFQAAFDLAKQYWPISQVRVNRLANEVQQKWPNDDHYGKNIGKEFISMQRIGESFLRYNYLHKMEHDAIYWQIDFYKARDLWRINNIVFHENLDPLYKSD